MTEEKKPIRFRCQCSRIHSLSAKHAGQKAKCACGRILLIPRLETSDALASRQTQPDSPQTDRIHDFRLPFGWVFDVVGVAVCVLAWIYVSHVMVYRGPVLRHLGTWTDLKTLLVFCLVGFAGWAVYDYQILASMAPRFPTTWSRLWLFVPPAGLGVELLAPHLFQPSKESVQYVLLRLLGWSGLILVYLVVRRKRWQSRVALLLEEERVPTEGVRLERSALAISSLILGILSFLTFGITGILGLVLGFLGLREIRRSSGALVGRGLAISGIALSGAGILAWVLIVVNP